MFKSKPKCPYCGAVLTDPPKTKKKCPACGNTVFFKVDPYTNKEYFLTEDNSVQINLLKERYRIEEAFFNIFNEYGLTEKLFIKRRQNYIKKAKNNYSAFAFVTSIFNELSLNFAKKNNYSQLNSLYYQMARFLADYNEEFFFYLQESAKMNLYSFKQIEKDSGLKHKVNIMAAVGSKNSSCAKCAKQNGKSYTIDEALEEMPIPVKDCENGFCRCLYTVSTVN
jgi:ribosomal protein S27AE